MSETKDPELLELAAKAAGLRLSAGHIWHEGEGQWVRWNPLTDDGDALGLVVRLYLLVQVRPRVTFVTDNEGNQLAFRQHKDDPYAATRRAIVRAAATVGRGK